MKVPEEQTEMIEGRTGKEYGTNMELFLLY